MDDPRSQQPDGQLVKPLADTTARGGLGVNGRGRLAIRPGRQWAADDADRQIRTLIVQGTLRPGQFINEQDLVDHLGIGRTPIREAIQRLALQHLVEVFPRRGIAVTKLGLDDIQAIFEARETIEERTAQLAAVRRSDEEAAELSALGKQIRSASTRDDFGVFLDVDQRLHHLIAYAARNEILAEIADHLLMLSDWVWHQYFFRHGSNPSDYFNHEPIVRAVVDRDPDAAAAAMREHVDHSRDVIRMAM